MTTARTIVPLGLLLTVLYAAFAASDPAYWPQWRGPFGNGMAKGDAPTEWSDTKNVAWKTPIPGRGHSTPVIWGDRIFLTTAVPTGKTTGATAAAPQQGRRGGFGGGGAATGQEHRFVVLCLDRKTGKTLWEQAVKVATPHEGYHQRYGSFASNSPITDGERVYAFFGSRGLFCYDLDGRLLWKKEYPPLQMKMQFGEGSAPTLSGERLILNVDHEAASFIVALDKKNGNELWRTARDETSSWSTPLVVEHQGRRQIVVSASSKVRAYDLQTGKLLWDCAGLGANAIPAPVAQNGIVYVMTGFRNPNLMAIRLDRQGDLTGSDAVLWTNQRGNSYTPSPVLDDNKLYFLTDSGMLSCLNATTGQPYYQQQRLPKPANFKASPVGAAGKLYLATEDGDVVVVKMGERFEVLATNTLGNQGFIASPVIAEGSLYLRSQEALYCIRQ